MEERGHVESEWGVTKNSRRARYYKLTAAGRAQLRAETARLLDDADALITVLETKRT